MTSSLGTQWLTTVLVKNLFPMSVWTSPGSASSHFLISLVTRERRSPSFNSTASLQEDADCCEASPSEFFPLRPFTSGHTHSSMSFSCWGAQTYTEYSRWGCTCARGLKSPHMSLVGCNSAAQTEALVLFENHDICMTPSWQMGEETCRMPVPLWRSRRDIWVQCCGCSTDLQGSTQP